MMWLLLFHAAFSLLYVYTIAFDYDLTKKFKLRLPIPGMFFSKLVWLTMINLYVQAAYHSFAILLLIYERRARAPSHIKAQFHKYASTITFPLALTVVILFWGLVFLDPDFLINEDAKKILYIPWFNHAVHTVPLIAMVLDHIFWRHRRAKKADALSIISIFLFSYLGWVHYVHFVYDFWAYPILGKLNTFHRTLFFAFCVVFFFSAYLLSDLILYVSQRVLKTSVSHSATISRAGRRKKD